MVAKLNSEFRQTLKTTTVFRLLSTIGEKVAVAVVDIVVVVVPVNIVDNVAVAVVDDDTVVELLVTVLFVTTEKIIIQALQ